MMFVTIFGKKNIYGSVFQQGNNMPYDLSTPFSFN